MTEPVAIGESKAQLKSLLSRTKAGSGRSLVFSCRDGCPAGQVEGTLQAVKVSNSPLPCSVAFQTESGVIPNATAHYQKHLSDLRGLFLDPAALELRIREEGDPVCYENYAFNQSQAEGDIFFGTTIIYPGKVGVEYHLTRGHYHRKRNHAETYQAISGRGLVLFEREDGRTATAELAPGKVTYVAPFWAHRSVNTSDVPLVFLWTCSVEAGHDYEGLGGRGMRQVVVERHGVPRVEDRATK